MAHVYIDKDGDEFTVRVMTGIRGDKTSRFPSHPEAVAFAETKMGKRGMILDSSAMTPEQRTAQQARDQRARALLAKTEH